MERESDPFTEGEFMMGWVPVTFSQKARIVTRYLTV